MKYALLGKMTNEAYAMADMPHYWQRALSGQGELNLSAVPLLSNHHYLWSPNKITAKLTGFLASTSLASKVKTLAKHDYPTVFQHAAFKGEVYALDEMVIDVLALVRELAKQNQGAIFKIDPVSETGLQWDAEGKWLNATLSLSGQSLQVCAQHLVWTAGAGNALLCKHLNDSRIEMQRRPLHMVMVKLPFDYPLYAHCLGLSNRPRITITTHYLQEGSPIWYLGGALAEEGVHRDQAAQIAASKEELHKLFPWLDFSSAHFASFIIDRAEPKQKGGMKPETAFSQTIHNQTIAWPTKLALAPKLAETILSNFSEMQLIPKYNDLDALQGWSAPPLARGIGEEFFCKDVV